MPRRSRSGVRAVACAAGDVAMSADAVTVALLADHPLATAGLQRLFESE